MGTDEHLRSWEPADLAKRLSDLHEDRRKLKKERKAEKQKRRRPLTYQEQQKVLGKTDSRCHLCGGVMNENAEGDYNRNAKLCLTVSNLYLTISCPAPQAEVMNRRIFLQHMACAMALGGFIRQRNSSGFCEWEYGRGNKWKMALTSASKCSNRS